MFSFFGLFADPAPGLREQIQTWIDADVVELEQPSRLLAVRFGGSLYEPASEDLPEAVSIGVQQLSQQNRNVRFVLLRTECWGGVCENWGRIIQNGSVIGEADGSGALRRLIGCFDVDLGVQEIFDPLRRDFSWRD